MLIFYKKSIERYIMIANDIVDIVQGLVSSKEIVPPFEITLPSTTSLNEQYIDEVSDLSLGEKLLKIKDVKSVKVGKGSGVSISHYEG